MKNAEVARRMPIGAEPLPGGGVHFRVWAPRCHAVQAVLEAGPGAPATVALARDEGGYFGGTAEGAGAGTRYRYRLDGGESPYPDPASRFQPEGPHGPSEVVDPGAFRWGDDGWRGVEPGREVLYELHVGTFTPEGTWAAAAGQLEALAELGVTLLEVMPVADFPGDFGWGYDGVDLFAPTRLYGAPDDFRRFVDRAHALGVGVILDVVYNHLGPDGNYLPRYSESYFTDRYQTEWGEPLDFDGPGSGPVRELFVANAAYWIREFHLDGLRLDATQNIYDAHDPPEHILTLVTRAAREAGGGRRIFVVAENEPQDTTLLRSPERGGYGMDAAWNDDYHHAALVALTGRNEAYYSDYLGAPQEFVSAARWGYLYQGQNYRWQRKRRGTPALDLPPRSFVAFLQNHDQVANSLRGARIDRLASPARLRAMTALTLLGPAIPLLFMGQEFAASAPFLYFADHSGDLARQVREGRREFLSQFPSIAAALEEADATDPDDPATFRRCKLDPSERESHAEAHALHRDLLRLRREDPVIRAAGEHRPDGAVLGGDSFALRYSGAAGDDRLLVVNLGRDLHFSPAPQPLLAPPAGDRWTVLWSSEDERYGGSGAPPPESEDGAWFLPGEAAVLLGPAETRADVQGGSEAEAEEFEA
jgi:maltooligosyltrehalose trehalohydrolase